MAKREILSLTVREEAATVYTKEAWAGAIERARSDFPEYRLEAEQARGGVVITTVGMRVQRWLRE